MSDAEIPFEVSATLDSLTEFARSLAGNAASYERTTIAEHPIAVVDIDPVEKHSCPINIIGEQFLIVTVGSVGGRWELSYSNDDVNLAKQIIAAVVAGDVTERSAFGRSRVTVILEDRTSRHETGFDGCVSLLVPQPGWTRWGRLTTYLPYSS